MVKREYPESQPKYAIAQAIPNAGTGRMRSPYPKLNDWYYKDESTERRLVPYETFTSAAIPFINGASVSFTHNWSNFDPSNDWYQIQAWARCIQNQAGWNLGEIALLNGRRCTVSVTNTEILIQIGANGANIGRKNGNLNEFSLNPNRWRLFVQGMRKVT